MDSQPDHERPGLRTISFLPARGNRPHAVLTVTASTERLDHVLWMVNPEKITAVHVPA